MMIAIHQPHYFPWLGYMAKMASVDKFILMDTVQLEKKSYMLRNRIINPDGEIKYLTVSCEKDDYCEREYRDFRTKDFKIWTDKQKGRLIKAYKKCWHFDEIWDAISPIFMEEHELLCDVTMHSINILREILGVNTPLIMQSDIEIDSNLNSGLKKGERVLELCKAVGADTYYAGRGVGMHHLDIGKFNEEKIQVLYQDFSHPEYRQIGNHLFVPGLSALDLLFNQGIEKSKEIFWDSVERKDKRHGHMDGV